MSAYGRNETLTLTVQLAVLTPTENDLTKHEKRMTSHSRVIVLDSSRTADMATFTSLLPPDSELEPNDLVFVLPYHTFNRDTSLPAPSSKSEAFFPPLDRSVPIIEALKGTAFVEFPTVHVYPLAIWEASRNDGRVVVMPLLAVLDETNGMGRFGRKGEMRERDDGYKRVRREEPPAAVSSVPASTIAPVPAVPMYTATSLPVRFVAVPPLAARPISLGLGLADYGSDDEEEEADDVLGGDGE